MLQQAPAQPASASGNADGTTGSGAASATNVPDVEAAAYSQELAGMSLDRLRQEPWRLRTAQEEVVSNLTAVSLRHYRLHIENFECATIVKREVRRRPRVSCGVSASGAATSPSNAARRC